MVTEEQEYIRSLEFVQMNGDKMGKTSLKKAANLSIVTLMNALRVFSDVVKKRILLMCIMCKVYYDRNLHHIRLTHRKYFRLLLLVDVHDIIQLHKALLKLIISTIISFNEVA